MAEQGVIIELCEDSRMVHLERVWDEQNRVRVLSLSAIIVTIIGLADWWTKPYVSLGFLYLFPIMLAAGFLPRWAIVALGVASAGLSEAFNSLETSIVRLGFETLALAGCGLFVAELVRNRRMGLEAQARLHGLVETSPAAIVTVDERGFVELANRAANDLMNPRDGNLAGNPIAAFLPELHHALRLEEAPQFRTSMQCQGHRGNGETFMAEVWFSTYIEGKAHKLAAIIAPLEEQGAGADGHHRIILGAQLGRIALNEREMDVLRLLVQGLINKEIASRLDVSESAVKNTMQQLFAKTMVRTRSQLVRVAVEHYRDLL